MKAQAETACQGTVKGPGGRDMPLYSHIPLPNPQPTAPRSYTPTTLVLSLTHEHAHHPKLLTVNTLLF